MYRNLIDLFKENEGKGAVGAFNAALFRDASGNGPSGNRISGVPVILQTSLWHCQIHRI